MSLEWLWWSAALSGCAFGLALSAVVAQILVYCERRKRGDKK